METLIQVTGLRCNVRRDKVSKREKGIFLDVWTRFYLILFVLIVSDLFNFSRAILDFCERKVEESYI